MQQFVLVLDGLTVPVKAANLESLLRQKFGGVGIDVDFVESRVTAKGLNEEQKEALTLLIQKSGFRVISDCQERFSELLLDEALDDEQKTLLEDTIASNSEIEQSFIDHAKGLIRLSHRETFSIDDFICALNNHGIRSRLAPSKINDRLRNLRDYCTLFSTLMLITGTVLQSLGGDLEQWLVVPFFVALLTGLWPLLEDGIIGVVQKKRLTFASVVFLFVLICLHHELWFEAAFVATVYSISLFLERQFFRHIRHRLLMLRRLPRHAWVVENDKAHCVSEVSAGDVIQVDAGEIVFADGEIIEGSAGVKGLPLVNASRHQLTIGDKVFAGYRVLEGQLRIKVLRNQQDSRWSEFLQNVHASINSSFPEWLMIRKWTLLFSSICLSLALIFVVMMDFQFSGIQANISMVLAMLLISGPVAVTSTTQGRILLSILHLAERGIVIKKGEFISRLAGLKNIFVDKTGVITEGRFKLEEIITMHEQSIKSLLQIARSLLVENYKGRYASVIERAEREAISPLPVADIEQIRQEGFSGIVDGQKYILGSYRLMKEYGLTTSTIAERLERWQHDGIDVLFLANENEVIAMFNIVDRLQSDVALCVDGLHSLGVKNQVLLTGDNEVTADQLGHRMGYDKVVSEMSADEKVEMLSNVEGAYFGAVVSARSKVLNVPYLLKVSIRSLFRNKEQRLSDVFVLGDNLQWLPELVTVSSKTLSQLRNLSIVFISYKLMLIAAVMSGGLALWMTMLLELLFIYAMWLASTREHFLQWTNPATQPKSLMQLPPPRKQRIFSTGLIR